MFDRDLSPFFRTTVGFDRMARLLNEASRLNAAQNAYPPYDIEKLDANSYQIQMAVAGFSESDLDITLTESTLVVSGKVGEPEPVEGEETPERQFIHRGIARRAFERRFELADHIKVASASLENGLLSIKLVREIPEAMKPRRIEIGSASGAKVIEQKKAA